MRRLDLRKVMKITSGITDNTQRKPGAASHSPLRMKHADATRNIEALDILKPKIAHS